MRRLFLKYHKHLTYDIKQPVHQILAHVANQKEKKRNFWEKLSPVPLDYDEVNIKGENRLEIENFKYGKIIIDILRPPDHGVTHLKSELIPYHKNHLYGFSFLFLFFFIVFIICLSLGASLFLLTSLSLFLCLFILLSHLSFLKNKSALKEMLEYFAMELRRNSSR